MFFQMGLCQFRILPRLKIVGEVKSRQEIFPIVYCGFDSAGDGSESSGIGHFANGHVELETRHFGGKVFLGFCTEFFHSGFDLDCSRGAEGAEWSDGDHSVETSFTIGISTIDGFSGSSADRVVIVSLDCEGGTSCQEKQTA